MKTKIIPYNPILKERAKQLRKNMTPGESALWQHLKGKQMCGYDFDRQRPIDQFIVDFYCKKLMLAIEIDGSSHDSMEAQECDRERQTRLESLGVRFLRFLERDVCREEEEVLKAIEGWIRSHASLIPPTPSSQEGDLTQSWPDLPQSNPPLPLPGGEFRLKNRKH